MECRLARARERMPHPQKKTRAHNQQPTKRSWRSLSNSKKRHRHTKTTNASPPKENTRAQPTTDKTQLAFALEFEKKTQTHKNHKPTMTAMKRTRSSLSSFSYTGMIRLLLVLLGWALALAATEEDHHEPCSRRTRTVPTTTLATHPNAVSPRPPRFATSPIPHHQEENSQPPPHTAETTTTQGDTVHDQQSFRYGVVVTLLPHRRILLPPLGDTDASTPIGMVPPPPPLLPPGLPAPPNGCEYVCDQDEDEEDPDDKDDNDSPKHKKQNHKKNQKDQSSSHSGKKEKGQGKKETMTKQSKRQRHSGKKELHKKKNPQDRTRHQQRRQLITSTTSASSGGDIPIGSDTPIDIETCRLVCVDGAPFD